LKLVKESLEQTFTRGSEDKLESLGIGKRGLIEKWLDKNGVTKYFINDKMEITVLGHVDLSQKHLKEIPSYISFENVTGQFSCGVNELTSLRGCPERIGGSFDCESNKLTTLDYAPKTVGGAFYCTGNYISKEEQDKYFKGAFIDGVKLINPQYI
jgi:hypothetical protein